MQPPVQVLGRARRAIAGGSGDQQVPARPQAAPDLGEEGRGMREVLQDQDREDASQRRVGEAQRPADVVHAEPRADLVARGLCPRDLDHARRPVDAHDVVTAPRECQRVRARTAAEVGDRSRRGHHARDLTVVRSTSSRCSGSLRRRAQAALSRSYMKRKNQRGAGMAAMVRVRLPAGVPMRSVN